jgi:diguanylate cyclase (GGDEF)-like protein
LLSGTWAEFFKRWISFGEDRWASLTEDLNLHRFVENLLTYAQRECGASNVVWLRHDELTRFKEIASGSKVYEPDQLLHRDVKVRPFNPIPDQDIIAALKAFDPDALSVQQTTASQGYNYFLPVTDSNTSKNMAGILLLGVQPAQKAGVTLVSKGLAKVAKHARFCLEHWEATTETFHDDLTDLYNQKFMAQVLESEIHRAGRLNANFAVLFMDIDHFKAINDQKGHWVGSKVLVELARVMRRHVRKSDYAFRYGGDEFVIICPDTTAEGARIAGERIRSLIEATDFLIDGVHLKLTISIGVAGFPEHAKTHREIIRMADEAMYCGKKSRNMVFVANS